MSDLTEWLLACIAEDETLAEAAAETWDSDRDGGWFNGLWDETGTHVRRNDPAHVLAVCKAHRAIIDWFFWNAEAIDGEWGDGCDVEQIRAGECHDRHVAQSLRPLRALATIYADRPGWREEWAA